MIKRIPQVARDDLTRNMLLFSLLERGIFTSTASNLILSQGNRATHSTMFHIRHLQGEPHRLNKDRRCALHQQETKDGDSSIQRRRIRKQSLHSSRCRRIRLRRRRWQYACITSLSCQSPVPGGCRRRRSHRFACTCHQPAMPVDWSESLCRVAVKPPALLNDRRTTTSSLAKTKNKITRQKRSTDSAEPSAFQS